MIRRNWTNHHQHPKIEYDYDALVKQLWEPKRTPMENESASDFKDCIAYWSNPYRGFAVRYGLSKLPDIDVLPIIDFHDFILNGIPDRDYTFQPTYVNECIANAWLRNEFTSPKNGCPMYKSEHPVELFNDNFYEFFYNKWLPLINYWWVSSWSDADKFSLLGNLMTKAPIAGQTIATAAADTNTSGTTTSSLPSPIQLVVWFPSMEAVMKFRETNSQMYPPFLIEKINILLSPDFHSHLTRRLQDARHYKSEVRRVRELMQKKNEEKAAAEETTAEGANKRVRSE